VSRTLNVALNKFVYTLDEIIIFLLFNIVSSVIGFLAYIRYIVTSTPYDRNSLGHAPVLCCVLLYRQYCIISSQDYVVGEYREAISIANAATYKRKGDLQYCDMFLLLKFRVYFLWCTPYQKIKRSTRGCCWRVGKGKKNKKKQRIWINDWPKDVSDFSKNRNWMFSDGH